MRVSKKCVLSLDSKKKKIGVVKYTFNLYKDSRIASIFPNPLYNDYHRKHSIQ